MIFSLVLLTMLAAPAADPAAPSGAPPQQAVAIIDGQGTLKITQVGSAMLGPQAVETAVDVIEKKGTDKGSVKVKVRTSQVVLTTVELAAKYVDAYTVDGTSISREKLTELLAKERTVLVATNGARVDPFHLQLYKEGTIVLVPPANILGFSGGPFNGVPPPQGGPIPLPALNLRDSIKPTPDDKKP